MGGGTATCIQLEKGGLYTKTRPPLSAVAAAASLRRRPPARGVAAAHQLRPKRPPPTCCCCCRALWLGRGGMPLFSTRSSGAAPCREERRGAGAIAFVQQCGVKDRQRGTQRSGCGHVEKAGSGASRRQLVARRKPRRRRVGRGGDQRQRGGGGAARVGSTGGLVAVLWWWADSSSMHTAGRAQH